MAKLMINKNKKEGTIAPEIYGHFSEHLGRCIYEGLYVGENSEIPNVNGMRTDVVEALKEIKIPVLRWPGGCFADEYHWKDGIGPKENRKKMINTHWGGVFSCVVEGVLDLITCFCYCLVLIYLLGCSQLLFKKLTRVDHGHEILGIHVWIKDALLDDVQCWRVVNLTFLLESSFYIFNAVYFC